MTTIASHNGPFHADDVAAVAMLRAFHVAEPTVVRSRDPKVLDAADIVVDVGGIFDPSAGRFDHHQKSYEGPRSSAGMILDWLESEGTVSAGLAADLRSNLVDYLDDVDNGRVAPQAHVMCFPRIVDALNQPADTQEQFDTAFLGAVEVGLAMIQGLETAYNKRLEARAVIGAAMDDAVKQGTRVIYLDHYISWKTAYFDLGGAEHPTDYVVFPGTDGSWRIIGIPPVYGDFAQKRPLPKEWAGLTDAELEAVTGIEGSVFCHKNLFIAVFATREGVVAAIEKFGLDKR